MKRFTQPSLIIVTGRPASGKSTLANWLGKEFMLPVVSKDGIREILFDQLGWSDRTWAQQLGRAGIDLMFYFARSQLESGHSLIMDNAFHPEPSTPRFRKLRDQTNAQFLQIICDADSKRLWQRFVARAKSGNRHPGHGDARIQDELWENLAMELSPVMNVGGNKIDLNTTDFSTLDYAAILTKVRSYLNG